MGFEVISNYLNKNARAKQKNKDFEKGEDGMDNDNAGYKENSAILSRSNIRLNLESVDKFEAIKMAGKVLVDGGYVDEKYIDAMIEREKELTTYIGSGVAIPHGVGRAKELIEKSGISVLQFPDGIDFGEEKAYLVIGIAGVGNEHITILSNIATIIGDEDDEKLKMLKTTKNVEQIYKAFISNNILG